MAKKKTRTEQVCDDAIGLLKDTIRDLEVLGAGRGDANRRYLVRRTLWSVCELTAT